MQRSSSVKRGKPYSSSISRAVRIARRRESEVMQCRLQGGQARSWASWQASFRAQALKDLTKGAFCQMWWPENVGITRGTHALTGHTQGAKCQKCSHHPTPTSAAKTS